MSKAKRILWSLFLVFFAGGCATYRPVAWPQSDESAPVPDIPVEVAGSDKGMIVMVAILALGALLAVSLATWEGPDFGSR